MKEKEKREMIKRPKERQNAKKRSNKLKSKRTRRGVRARLKWRFSLETPRYSKPSSPGALQIVDGWIALTNVKVYISLEKVGAGERDGEMENKNEGMGGSD